MMVGYKYGTVILLTLYSSVMLCQVDEKYRLFLNLKCVLFLFVSNLLLVITRDNLFCTRGIFDHVSVLNP